MKKTILIQGLLLLSSASALATEYTIDSAHSNADFTIKHMFTKVRGSFNDFEGEFSFDEKKVADSKGKFTIQTKSINTNNAKRDEHLRSADFFNAEKNPTLTFESDKASGSGKKFKLSGKLTMNGVTQPVTFDVEYLGTAVDPWKNKKASFTASATIKRKDFKIIWNKTLDNGSFMLGEDVKIDIQVEAGEKKAKE